MMKKRYFAAVEVVCVAVLVASLITNFILWQEVRDENYTKYMTCRSQYETMQEMVRALERKCVELQRGLE
jgi:hypothetical protein